MKMKQKRITVVLMCLFIAILSCVAQVQVTSKVDSMSILVGQQTGMTITVTAPKGAKVIFPKFKTGQLITPGIELIDQKESIVNDGEDESFNTYDKTYILTSFDDKLYAIPSLPVVVNGKTYKTNVLALKVLTVDVDTVHPQKFFPPKDVQDNPFVWSEWVPMFIFSVVFVVFFIVFILLEIRLKQNKPIVKRIRIIKKIPPHQKALKAIEKLKEEKMSSSADQKTYYTLLTDTLRQYIEERFGFNAKEMTSTEILACLQQNGDQKMLDELRELFYTADLVKFAKYSTLLNENDLNLVNAINFIDSTKLVSQPTEEKIMPQLSNDDVRARKNRLLVKTVIAILLLIMAGIVGYVSYHVYLLMI